MSRRQSPSYMDCTNDYDYITYEDWDEKSDIIYIYNNNRWECFDRESLQSFWRMQDSVMAFWKGGDVNGFGGSPDDDYLYYKLPNGTWVDEQSMLLVLDNPEKHYFEAVIIHHEHPIGNLLGHMGISMLHGNNPQTIYKLNIVEGVDYTEENEYLENEVQRLQEELDEYNQLIEIEEKDTFNYILEDYPIRVTIGYNTIRLQHDVPSTYRTVNSVCSVNETMIMPIKRDEYGQVIPNLLEDQLQIFSKRFKSNLIIEHHESLNDTSSHAKREVTLFCSFCETKKQIWYTPLDMGLVHVRTNGTQIDHPHLFSLFPANRLHRAYTKNITISNTGQLQSIDNLALYILE